MHALRSKRLRLVAALAGLLPTLGCGLGSLVDHESDVVALVEGENVTNVEVTQRSEDGLTYEWNGRRDWELCTGSVTYSSAFDSSPSSELTCGLALRLEVLEEGCDAREARACALAAQRLRREQGDVARMTTLAQRACEGGEATECFYVGVALEHGDRGLPQNHNLAFVNYVRACDANEPVGCFNAAILRYGGDGAEPQHDQACQYWRRSCDLDYMRGCADLGQCYRDGEGVPRDYARARELLLRSCEAGVGAGCTNLGRMYAGGEGVPVDHVQAHRYYTEGCEHESGRGCRLAALWVLDGHVPGVNRLQGAAALERLCSQGDLQACFEGALALHEGRNGLPQNRALAYRTFQSCCRRGHAGCCNNQGVYTMNGWGGAPRDPVAAGALYRRACDMGDSAACRNLR